VRKQAAGDSVQQLSAALTRHHPRAIQSVNLEDSQLQMAASIGEQLRLAREGRGIPLREISDQTRISVRYLEAIESNDYGRLPGGVFNRSFIKAYARCVGYDEKEAIEGYTRYLREHGDGDDDVNTTPIQSKVYTDTPATRSPLLTVVLTILILALLTAGALAAVHWFQKRASLGTHGTPQSFAIAMVQRNVLDIGTLSDGSVLGSTRTEHKAVLQ
jgi:cytoskeletal protein RodZ